MTEFRAYFRSVAISSVGNTVASALAAALLLPLLIRQAGLATYGQWAVLGIFVGISSLLDFGVLKATVFLVSRHSFGTREVASTAIVVSTLAGVTFAVCLVTLLVAGVPLFGSLPAAPPHISWWLCGSGIVVVLASLYANVFRGLLEAAMLGHLVNVGFAVLTLLQYGVLVLLALLDLDVRWLLGASAVVYVAIAGFHFYHVRRASGFTLGRPSMKVARGIFSYGLRSYLSEVPINLMNPVVLYLFVLNAGAGESYGVLDISLRLSGLAASALGALAMPFFAISAAADAEGSGRANALAGRFLRVSLPLAIGVCLVYGFAGEPFVRLVFGGRAHDIWSTSLIVLTGAILVAALEPIARLLMGTQRLGWLSMTRYAMLLATLVAIVALRPFAILDRFSAALAIGYAVSALGLLAARSSWLSRSPQDSALRVER